MLREIACNVLTLPGPTDDLLTEVLIGWFGDQAGEPGADHNVEFTELGTDRLTLRPSRPPM